MRFNGISNCSIVTENNAYIFSGKVIFSCFRYRARLHNSSELDYWTMFYVSSCTETSGLLDGTCAGGKCCRLWGFQLDHRNVAWFEEAAMHLFLLNRHNSIYGPCHEVVDHAEEVANKTQHRSTGEDPIASDIAEGDDVGGRGAVPPLVIQ